MINIRLLIAR